MVSKRAVIILLVVIVGAACAAFFYQTRRGRVQVMVEPVRRGHVESTVTAATSGTIDALVDAVLTAEMMGTIEAMNYDEGEKVEEGAVILSLKRNEFEANLHLAEANLKAGDARLAQAKAAADVFKVVSDAEVAQAKTRLKNTEDSLKRVNELHAQGVVSETAQEDSEVVYQLAVESHNAALASRDEYQVRLEEIKIAEANVKQLEAAVEVAQAQLDKTELRAPLSGVLGERYVDLGQSVVVGSPLFRLIDTSTMKVEASIDEVDSSGLRVGQKVRVELDAYPLQSFAGKLVYISSVISMLKEMNRTVMVKVEMTEAQELCKVGMSTDVTVILDERDDVLYVPTDAVIDRADGNYVYVVNGHKAVLRRIELGLTNWDTSEVVEGVDESDPIITSLDVRDLVNGARVEVVDELE